MSGALQAVFQNQRMNIDFKRVMRYVNLSDSFISANKTGLTKIKYTQLIPDSMKYRVKQSALNKVSELKNIVQQKKLDDESRERDLRYHKMEWHRKFSISLACLVLFFIGAPLGAIIRKGGLGMPLVVAIVFFLIFRWFRNRHTKYYTQNPRRLARVIFLFNFYFMFC
jgi:lipopolysaccharide export system permease protein